MSRNSNYYHKLRWKLIDLLGGKCVAKNCANLSDELHIDHIDGRDWEPRKLSSHCRVARYWREYKAGVKLRVLCKVCNGYLVPKKKRRKIKEV